MPDKWMSVAEAATVLKVHPRTIERRIAGRYFEQFKSKNVRNEFYGLMDDPTLRDEIVLLLVRDPWQADVPRLLNLLEITEDDHCTALVNALFRYKLNNSQFGGKLPEDAKHAVVLLVLKDVVHELGNLYVFTRETPAERGKLKPSNQKGKRINELLDLDNQVIIQRREGGLRVVWKFNDVMVALEKFHQFGYHLDLHHVVSEALRGAIDQNERYCDLGDSLNYNIEKINVYLISPAAAKSRWLKWWQDQSSTYKQSLLSMAWASQ